MSVHRSLGFCVFILILLLICTGPSSIYAQSEEINEHKLEYLKGQVTSPGKENIQFDKQDFTQVNEKCGMMYVHKMMEGRYDMGGLLEENSEKANRVLRNTDHSRAITTIPIVIHIIHNGEPLGMGANISDTQVLSQVDVLNADFRRMNMDAGNTPSDFTGVAADVELEFCLATVDPEGNMINGIHRYNGGQSFYSITDLECNIKPNTIWNPEYYFNIWVAPLQGGLLGYAQFPEGSGLAGMPPAIGPAGPEYTDGIVVRDLAFGTTGSAISPFDGGRTATHEVGHFFGLRHIGGDGDCSVDDFCADTPTQFGQNENTEDDCSYPADNDCDDGPGDLPDQFMNYMDYSDDACMNLYTQDQKDRVNVVLANSPRRSFSSSMVCNGIPPGESWSVDIEIPENDMCNGAIPINCGEELSGSTCFATTTGDPTGFCGTPPTAPGVWYTFEGTGDLVTISTCNAATFDTKINVYEGDCSSLVCVGGNDDDFFGCGVTSRLTIPTIMGNTYYVMVNGFGGAIGDFLLSIRCAGPPPSNDICDDAIPIACGDSIEGTTFDATSAGAPPNCVTSITTPGVWYSLEGNDSFVTISTCDQAGFDTKITAYTGSCGIFNCVTGNDDGSGCSGFTSEVDFFASSGITYYIYVSGFGGATGDFTLSAICSSPEPNDLCMNARFIDCGNIYQGNNVFATTSTLLPPQDCNPGDAGPPQNDAFGPGVWYYFQAAGNNMITLSTCNDANFDTKIDVFTGGCENLICLAGSDDAIGCGGFTSEVSFEIFNNEIYYVYVSGFTIENVGTSQGEFTLTMTCAKPIPTLSQWSMIQLGLLFLIFAVLHFSSENIMLVQLDPVRKKKESY